MKSSISLLAFFRSLGKRLSTALAALSLAAVIAHAQTPNYLVLNAFTGGGKGAYPSGNLISNSTGTILYGVTIGGSSYANSVCSGLSADSTCGTVFKISGGVEEVLYEFTGGTDGGNVVGGLVADSAGTLYGTAYNGGAYNSGTIFELSPSSGGGYSEKTLYSFQGVADGAFPTAAMIFDKSGNLFGTTYAGASAAGCGFGISCGTVFELSPTSAGWKETILYTPETNISAGVNPYGGLVFDNKGNLYGTTKMGGNLNNSNCGYPYYGCGTIFRLSPNSTGSWTETTLFKFNVLDGEYPMASLVIDSKGNLYGTTEYGGAAGAGTVFRLAPNASGGFTGTTLYNFRSGLGSGGGEIPVAGVTLGPGGSLFGTAIEGGANGDGVVYQLLPTTSGPWKEIVLHNFAGSGDGSQPYSALTPGPGSTLFGTTQFGGDTSLCGTGCGTVFEIKP